MENYESLSCVCPGWDALACSPEVSGNAWARAPLRSGDGSSQTSADSKAAEAFYLCASVLLDYLLLPFQITGII